MFFEKIRLQKDKQRRIERNEIYCDECNYYRREPGSPSSDTNYKCGVSVAGQLKQTSSICRSKYEYIDLIAEEQNKNNDCKYFKLRQWTTESNRL